MQLNIERTWKYSEFFGYFWGLCTVSNKRQFGPIIAALLSRYKAKKIHWSYQIRTLEEYLMCTNCPLTNLEAWQLISAVIKSLHTFTAVNGFQKFFRMMNRNETTYFLNLWLLVNFWSTFKISLNKKKLVDIKNQFFHECQPCEEIFEIRPYWWWLIFTIVCLSFYVPVCSFFLGPL